MVTRVPGWLSTSPLALSNLTWSTASPQFFAILLKLSMFFLPICKPGITNCTTAPLFPDRFLGVMGTVPKNCTGLNRTLNELVGGSSVLSAAGSFGGGGGFAREHF